MNVFRKKIFSFQIICKSKIKLNFHKLHDKVNYLIKTAVFSLIGNYLRTSNNYRQLIFNINAVVLIDTDNLLRFTKLVKCIPEF